MSRQSTRITRWLTSTGETAESAEPPSVHPTTGSLPTPAPPPLPQRTFDTTRPKVQSLTESTRQVRRHQVGPDAHTSHPTPVPPELHGLRDDLAHLLDSMTSTWEGLCSTVVATASGGALASTGLPPSGAEALARATSKMCRSLGLPEDELDVAALSLTSGQIVAVTRIAHPNGEMFLRLTSQDTPMGLVIVQTQRAARKISAL